MTTLASMLIQLKPVEPRPSRFGAATARWKAKNKTKAKQQQARYRARVRRREA